MRRLIHRTFEVADNTDCFAGTILENLPQWARRLRVQVSSVDHDAVYTCTLGEIELARGTISEVHGADNLQSVDSLAGFQEVTGNLGGRRLTLNLNVTTGSSFIATAIVEDR